MNGRGATKAGAVGLLTRFL